ncbi:MAG TPA: IclR family transcriptional regulator [Streptomyces sp.]
MTTPHSSPERSVVDRTLSILAAFDRDNRTLSLSDISRRCGLPVATVYRIVNKLHAWGALERSAEGGYSIGLRLWETASLAPRASYVVDAAHPHLLTLHRRTSAVTMIAIRDGSESVCLAAVGDDGPHQSLCGEGEGRRLPLHASAVGLILLAHAGETTQREALARPLRAYTPATVTDVGELRRSLVRVRREGHALIHGTFVPGLSSHAVPVRDVRGSVVAAVGVIGPPQRVRPAVTPHLHAAAAAITRELRTDGLARTGTGA